MNNNKRITDYEQHGREGEKMLKELRGKVCKKVANLKKAIKTFKKCQADYVVLTNFLYEKGDFELCELHIRNWFMMLLLLHDKSQLIQTGKFQFPKYQLAQKEPVDIICTDIRGDFEWGDHNERHQLNLISYQGYSYQHKELMKTMAKHDVSSQSLPLY